MEPREVITQSFVSQLVEQGLRPLFSAVLGVASRDPGRSPLNGVRVDESLTRMEATDGKVLIRIGEPIDGAESWVLGKDAIVMGQPGHRGMRTWPNCDFVTKPVPGAIAVKVNVEYLERLVKALRRACPVNSDKMRTVTIHVPQPRQAGAGDPRIVCDLVRFTAPGVIGVLMPVLYDPEGE